MPLSRDEHTERCEEYCNHFYGLSMSDLGLLVASREDVAKMELEIRLLAREETEWMKFQNDPQSVILSKEERQRAKAEERARAEALRRRVEEERRHVEEERRRVEAVQRRVVLDEVWREEEKTYAVDNANSYMRDAFQHCITAGEVRAIYGQFCMQLFEALNERLRELGVSPEASEVSDSDEE